MQNEKNVNSKVLSLLKLAIRPYIQEVKVDWGSLSPYIEQAPNNFEKLMDGDRLLIYGLVKKSSSIPETCKASISLTTRSGLKTTTEDFSIPLNLSDASCFSGKTIHQLSARQLLKEHKEDKKKSIEISLCYGIASSFTSFFAVDYRDSAVTGNLESKKIPMTEEIAMSAPTPVPYAPPPASYYVPPPPPPSSTAYYPPPPPAPSTTYYAPPQSNKAYFDLAAPMQMKLQQQQEQLPASLSYFKTQELEDSLAEAMEEESLAEKIEEKMLREYSPKRKKESMKPARTSTSSYAAPSGPPPAASPFTSYSSTASSKPSKAMLDQIVILQEFDGSWKLTAEFARTIHCDDLAKLESSIPSELSSLPNKETIWATAIILAIFQFSLKSFKQDWELLELKASEWLSKNNAPDLTPQAKKFLKSNNLI